MPRQSSDDEDFDPYHKWLGIPKDQRPPTHYQLLGISPNEEDEEAIESAAERQKLFVKGFEKGPRSRTASSVLYQIEEAKVTLLNPTMRDAYDERLGIRRDYRRTYEGKSPGATDFGSGSNSVGESGGFLKDYALYVAIFTTAFMVMAISAFYLPWEKISGNALNVAAKPIAPQNPDLPKPVVAPEPKDEEPEPPVPPVAKAEINPQETKSERENLLHGLDIEDLIKYGRWTSEPDALKAEANPSFNSLLIPHKFPELYALQVDYTILAGPAVVMSIPVGRNRLRVALYPDMIELSEVSNEMQRQSRHKTADYWGNAKEINFKRFSNGMGIALSPSIRHSALIEVKKVGSDILIRIQLEGKGAIVWRGPESDLSEGTNVDFWAKRNDALGSFRGLVIGTFQGSSVRLHNVKIHPVSDDSTSVVETVIPSKAAEPVAPLTLRLRNTKWTNSNNASFEWTSDGRLLHNGNERTWKVLNDRRGQLIFSPEHVDTLIFNETFTEFEQLIRGGPDSHQGRRVVGAL